MSECAYYMNYAAQDMIFDSHPLDVFETIGAGMSGSQMTEVI